MSRFKGLALIIVIACATGCSNPKAPELEALSDVQSGTAAEQLSITGIRFTALRDTALSLGARTGLHARAQQINAMINQYERPLERIFNFQALMLEKNVLPPVLVEGRNTLEQAAPDSLRIADRAYTIETQARFVTAPPTWRDYLLMQYDKPELPDRTLLPRDEVERKIWDRYVQQGWAAGLDQAHTIFAENVGLIKRDMEGMIRYRILLAQGMVSAPFVAKMDMGVTGGGDQMAVNDRMLQITAMPQLQSDSMHWGSNMRMQKQSP